jgi:23S rRNA (cytosine1962-C5)-methyltransferase
MKEGAFVGIESDDKNGVPERVPAKVLLRARGDRGLRRGYPWVFRNQIERVEGDPRTGDAVLLESREGKLFGQGLYHESSRIAVRFVTSDCAADIDAVLIARLKQAFEFRRAIFGDAKHWRAVHSESDGLPGTVIDRYDDVLVWSSVCAGIERRRELLLDVLEDLAKPRAIVERNDSWLRAKDGLEETRGLLRGRLDGPVLVEEDGLVFEVDVLEGPKTGLFLDQRFHRQLIRRFAPGRVVLDAFCADGGFGLHAAKAGAAAVHAIDASGPALARAARNAERNGLSNVVTFEQANVLDRIVELTEEGRRFDLVVLDPPAFARSAAHLEAALRSYQLLNINALKLLSPLGILATSSCSSALPEKEFVKMLRYAARQAPSGIRVLVRGAPPPDHPVLFSMPETSYLKFYIIQKTELAADPLAMTDDGEESSRPGWTLPRRARARNRASKISKVAPRTLDSRGRLGRGGGRKTPPARG